MADGRLDEPAGGPETDADRATGHAIAATVAEDRGDFAEALAHWRQALALSSTGSAEHDQISRRIAELSAGAGADSDADADGSNGATGAGGAGAGAGWLGWLVAAAMVAWKGKLLVVTGLTKLPTLLSMLATIGVYATLWGWKFALGLVLSIYVHEMGHVIALRRFGIAASAPMFIPGLGAFIRLEQYPATPVEDAATGIAGPAAGLVAALACLAGSLAFDSGLLGAVARVGAVINLFNLVPVWQLDGARAWRALDRPSRWLVVAALVAAYAHTGEGLVAIISAVAAFQALRMPVYVGDGPENPSSNGILAATVGIVAGLALIVGGIAPTP